MRPLLSILSFINRCNGTSLLTRIRLSRYFCQLAKKTSFGTADRLLAQRLTDLMFRHEPDSILLYPGYYSLLQAVINVARSNFIIDRERVDPPSYEELLSYSLRVANLPLKERLELIEALNRWMYFIYANHKGLMFVPHSAWHIFNKIRIFRESTGVPFEAYRPIVEETIKLADRAHFEKIENYREVPGFAAFITKLNQLEDELTPLYPSLQDYHQGGH